MEAGTTMPSQGPMNLSSPNSPSDPALDTSDVSQDFKLDLKICGVCGDKALGNNFNAITCESCKAFFRRNALKPKSFVCPFSDNCKVDAVTRRFCQKCRLKKCFEIGMKKEWIMTDEEKKLKKRKIEQNKVRRQGSEGALEPPPAKALILSPEGFEGHSLSPHTSSEDFGSPAGAAGVEQTRMPSSADSTTFDLPLVQSSDATCSQSSSSSSDLGYAMTPTVSQLLGSAHSPTSPVSSNQSSLGAGHAVQQANYGMSPRMQSETKGFQWSVEGGPSKPYAATPSFIPQSFEREPLRAADLSSGQVMMGQPAKASQLHPEYSGQQHVKLQQFSPSSSNQYQMPLLSSLIRPGDPESPPVGSSAASFGNQLQRQNAYGNGGGYGQIPVRQQLPDLAQSFVNFPQGVSPFGDEKSDEGPPPLPLNTMDSILSVAIRAEFNAFGRMCRPQEPLTKELNVAEVAKLQELLMACEALGDPVDQEGPLKLSKHSDPTLINVINLTDIAIRRLIKMSKKISAFKNMCQEDQIALLKGGCTEMMILRSVVTYDPDRDSWNIPHSFGYNIKLGVLKEARGNLYEEHQRFVKSFKPEWRADEKIMILLCAVTLFTAERPNVIHKDVVKLEQDSYYYLLKRYLESMLNGCEARSTYLLLIRKIAELRVLNSTHLRVFLEVNPREVEPLLREVFSMV